MKTADIRRDYHYGELLREHLDDSPFTQFEQWLQHALGESAIPDPTAMILSTVDSRGCPQQRTVLLKDHSESGFTFFTNLDSHKSLQMREHPQVSLLFQWLPLSRQVIISGSVARTDRATDEQYFASRPRESQLGAWASQQSTVLPDREALDQAFLAQQAHFADQPVPCPPNWGGWSVTPDHFEFWQGRPSRLHDRFVYDKRGNQWVISRLSP